MCPSATQRLECKPKEKTGETPLRYRFEGSPAGFNSLAEHGVMVLSTISVADTR